MAIIVFPSVNNAMTIATSKQGDFMVLPNDSLGKKIIETQDYEPHFYQTVSKLVRTGDVVIDCGANLGYHTVTLGKLVGASGKVLSFEPQRCIFQQLCGNVFLNNLRNVITLNNAVGDCEKDIQMDYVNIDQPDSNIGCTKIGEGGDKSRMLTIDQVIESQGLQNANITFIKADIQGCEVKMLEGAVKTIARCRPFMFVEIEGWLRSFDTTEEALKDKLRSLGYILIQIKNEWPTDHIAVPVEKEGMVPDIVSGLNCPYVIIK